MEIDRRTIEAAILLYMLVVGIITFWWENRCMKKRESKRMSDIIVDSTDRLFMSAEEELMQTLGWDSIVNLWRVYEDVEELEYKHRIIHKRSLVVHLAKRDRPDRPMYRTLCNLTIYPKWRKSKFELGYDDEEITCRRCLKKMKAER